MFLDHESHESTRILLRDCRIQLYQVLRILIRQPKPLTSKKFDDKAQGRERSERTMGLHSKQHANPEGVVANVTIAPSN